MVPNNLVKEKNVNPPEFEEYIKELNIFELRELKTSYESELKLSISNGEFNNKDIIKKLDQISSMLETKLNVSTPVVIKDYILEPYREGISPNSFGLIKEWVNINFKGQVAEFILENFKNENLEFFDLIQEYFGKEISEEFINSLSELLTNEKFNQEQIVSYTEGGLFLNKLEEYETYEDRINRISKEFNLSNSEKIDLEVYLICYDTAKEYFKTNPTVDDSQFPDLVFVLFNSYLDNKNKLVVSDFLNKEELNKTLNNTLEKINPTSISEGKKTFIGINISTFNYLKDYSKLFEDVKTHFSAFKDINIYEELLTNTLFLFYLDEQNSNQNYFLNWEENIKKETATKLVSKMLEESQNTLFESSLNRLLSEYGAELKPEIYSEMYNYFYSPDVTQDERFERFKLIYLNYVKTINELDFENELQINKYQTFKSAFAFLVLEEALHEDGVEDKFRNDLTNKRLIQYIVGFSVSGDMNLNDLLSIYYYNRQELDQEKENSPHDLSYAFYANLLYELEIDIGDYEGKGKGYRHDCYDALVQLEIFWYYGFQVRDKAELQAVFNFISIDYTSENTIKGSREDFLNVLRRTVVYNESIVSDQTSTFDKRYLAQGLLMRIFPIYSIVYNNTKWGNIKSKLQNRTHKYDLTFKDEEVGREFDYTSYEEEIKSARESSNTLHTIWFDKTKELQIHFPEYRGPSSFSPLKDNEYFGKEGDTNSFSEDIGPGVIFRVKPSYLSDGGSQHNFCLAYNKEGEIVTFEFHKENTLNSYNVELYPNKIRFNYKGYKIRKKKIKLKNGEEVPQLWIRKTGSNLDNSVRERPGR